MRVRDSHNAATAARVQGTHLEVAQQKPLGSDDDLWTRVSRQAQSSKLELHSCSQHLKRADLKGDITVPSFTVLKWWLAEDRRSFLLCCLKHQELFSPENQSDEWRNRQCAKIPITRTERWQVSPKVDCITLPSRTYVSWWSEGPYCSVREREWSENTGWTNNAEQVTSHEPEDMKQVIMDRACRFESWMVDEQKVNFTEDQSHTWAPADSCFLGEQTAAKCRKGGAEVHFEKLKERIEISSHRAQKLPVQHCPWEFWFVGLLCLGAENPKHWRTAGNLRHSKVGQRWKHCMCFYSKLPRGCCQEDEWNRGWLNVNQGMAIGFSLVEEFHQVKNLSLSSSQR